MCDHTASILCECCANLHSYSHKERVSVRSVRSFIRQPQRFVATCFLEYVLGISLSANLCKTFCSPAESTRPLLERPQHLQTTSAAAQLPSQSESQIRFCITETAFRLES